MTPNSLMRRHDLIFLAGAMLLSRHSIARSNQEDEMTVMRSAAIAAMTCCSLTVEAQTYTGKMSSGQSGPEIQASKAGGTAVVALAVSDGLVLAADSRLTLQYPKVFPGYKIASDSANKLFSIGRVAMATYGEAFVLGRSINSFVSEFQASLGDTKPDVNDTAKRFAEFFGKYYDQSVSGKEPSDRPAIGFILEGYDSTGTGIILQLEFPSTRVALRNGHNTRDSQGATWFGQTDVIQRLVKGRDPSLLSLPTVVELPLEKRSQLSSEVQGMEYVIPFNYFMLQDAIDFALAMVQATVDMQRFSFGTSATSGAIPGVGGSVDVIAVTPAGLAWIRQKTLGAR